MRPPALLSEAHAIEQANGYWLTKHVAVVMGVSVNSVRRMNIPRHHLETNRNSTRSIVVFWPPEVRVWMKARSTNQARKAS